MLFCQPLEKANRVFTIFGFSRSSSQANGVSDPKSEDDTEAEASPELELNAKIVNFIVFGVFLLPVGQFVILVKLNVLNGHKMDVVGAVGGNKWQASFRGAADGVAN